MAIKVNDVVCVTDTDNGEAWLGYCAGFTTKSELNKECEIVHFPYIIVTRDYGMGRVSVPVPPRFCS
jgi:hypothetical protein